MADISKITLPNGASYDIKDSVARQLIADLEAAGVKFVVADELPAASKDTVGKVYLIPHSHEEGKDIYDEYVTVEKAESYSWERIGNTDVDLTNYVPKTAHNDHTHSVTSNVTIDGASYTPEGSISGIAWTGSEMSSTGKYTPKGDVSADFSGIEATITVSGTPTGSVTAPSISTKNADGTAVDVYSISGVGQLTPSAYTPESYSVSDEVLIFTSSSYTPEQFTPPSREKVTITASEPTFSGTSFNSTGKYTPEGNVTNTAFTGTEDDISVRGTTTGSITSQGTFAGTSATIKPEIHNNAVTTGVPTNQLS